MIGRLPLRYAGPMTIASSAPSRLAHLLTLSLLLAPIPAAAKQPRKVAAARSGSSTVAATTTIIALPLNPTLPAGQRLRTSKAADEPGYVMLRPGSGALPGKADYVLVNYIGYLAATGVVFDQGMQSAFPVNGVIPGFSKGLQMLAKGGIARFCIPAAMGYGARETGTIPANADLVFQVELVDFKTAAEVEAMRKESAAEPADQPGATSPR
ncbi:FKBP-type peptidyl-prolyl cis-trans isomerase [Sphingobium sufflavum]|uniref:FKBP-type peptidyl-prolyl cis-trans isomerase n=1 Tax=Sphingobium sufflavum TaxID=1129547 RepID=UPI001F257D18|nr:FKBP-type peptidyl-prolyl cis-trans isomerase [Sphingobium sufflavum]MCE7798152.1 FKBP-type peptidyl-prolyl cis-trans isomerase [Sphingobium sufflavum]